MSLSVPRRTITRVSAVTAAAGTVTSATAGTWLLGWSTATPVQVAIVLCLVGAGVAAVGVLTYVLCRQTQTVITAALTGTILNEAARVQVSVPTRLRLCAEPPVSPRLVMPRAPDQLRVEHPVPFSLGHDLHRHQARHDGASL